MRGEETLCVGLLALGALNPPAVVLNLGSHWKAIRVDHAGRIAGSVTSLAGEMIQAVSEATILAGAVPPGRAQRLDHDWAARGMAAARRAGLNRALFAVRLLQLAGETTAEQRQAFLVGAHVAVDADALCAAGVLRAGTPTAIVGGDAVAGAWRQALADAAIHATCMEADAVERAMIAGLLAVHARATAAA
jgi:2-dehydro-3-deoxygalactonokinase